jgi:hypothetical protein
MSVKEKIHNVLKTRGVFALSVSVLAIALLGFNAGTAEAGGGSHNLGTPAGTDTDITATGDALRVTIPTTKGGGGSEATEASVSLSGTGLAASEVASVAAFYAGLEAGRTSSPGSLTNIVINLPGTPEKGGDPWTFFVNFNAGASVTNFVYTVNSITGTDNANLSFSTAGNATVNVPGAATQTLESFTDNSADSGVPVTDLQMATIASTATGGGVARSLPQTLLT